MAPHAETTATVDRGRDPELALLGRLVRLARRQNRYLRRRDAARLLANAAEWERYLDELARRRPNRERQNDEAPDPRREGERRRLLAELQRWNGHNARLARLGMELVQAEAVLLHPGLEVPDGTYARDGSRSDGIRGGTVRREA